MAGSRAYLASPPGLVGRATVLRELLSIAATRPGVLVVAGPPGAGATRLAREVATRLALDGAAVVDAQGPGPARERLAEALADQGLDPDLARAARLRPIVALLGDRPGEPGLAGELAGRLAGSRALVLMTAHEIHPDAPTLVVEGLAEDDAVLLASLASPGLDERAAREVAALGDGLPGRVVPLAHAARRRPGGDAPLPIPPALARPVEAAAAALEPWPRELAGWVAVVAEPTHPEALARVCRQDPARIARGLDALVAAGLLTEQPGPPRTLWRARDRLTRAVLLARLGGGEGRRRHAAALVAGRAAGRPAAELLEHALGAADPAAVVAYGARAARDAREAGRADLACEHADRALAWWSDGLDPAARLDALHERGLALLDLSSWEDAAASLEAAALGRRELGRPDAALASASAASSARWALGQHDAALRELRDHLGRTRAPDLPPSAARGEALAQAAGMAVMTSRFGEAMGLAGEAREVAAAAGADEVSTRALIFMGMAESGRGGPGGLLHLARARREGERASGAAQRNETLAVIHETHVLLALGRPDEAAAGARLGTARAADLGLADHALVLAGNLGEALTAAGELTEARAALERAAAGWAELGVGTPTPADPGLAWLLLAEGRIDAALERYRALAAAEEGAALFEQIAPVATGHALAALAAGDREEGARAVAGALEAWSRTDDRLTAIPMLAAGAETGPAETAGRCVAALAEMAAAGIPLAGAALAYAEGARPGGEPRRLRDAATAFEGLGMRWWSARARFAAGVADGRSEAAAQDLLAARAAFREMGGEGWRRRAEARLRAMGRRIPTRARRPTEPGAGLSAREQEVLAQAALGLRNRDIGERLFISERTVARHLVQINAKLGVSTRTAAVRAARERGLLDDSPV